LPAEILPALLPGADFFFRLEALLLQESAHLFLPGHFFPKPVLLFGEHFPLVSQCLQPFGPPSDFRFLLFHIPSAVDPLDLAALAVDVGFEKLSLAVDDPEFVDPPAVLALDLDAYDLARQLSEASEVKCSAFAEAIVKNMD